MTNLEGHQHHMLYTDRLHFSPGPRRPQLGSNEKPATTQLRSCVATNSRKRNRIRADQLQCNVVACWLKAVAYTTNALGAWQTLGLDS